MTGLVEQQLPPRDRDRDRLLSDASRVFGSLRKSLRLRDDESLLGLVFVPVGEVDTLRESRFGDGVRRFLRNVGGY